MSKKKTDYKKLSEELAQENAVLNNALLRERADATNVRKRAEDAKIQLAGYYKAIVIKEILPVIDNFERALLSLDSAGENVKQKELYKGIESIQKQFAQSLKKLGVERIKTIGNAFNPELHHAVTMEEGNGKQEIITEELQSGYKMGDEVLRHAMVRVKG